jgi:acyl-ACP thioesterase
MPQRCDKVMEGFPQCSRTAVAKELTKLQPGTEGEVVNSFKSPFMAIDKAQHTNNAMYMRWVMNALDETDQKRNVRSVDISYVRETPMNDVTTIKRHRPSADEYNFVMENSRGLSMICNLRLE